MSNIVPKWAVPALSITWIAVVLGLELLSFDLGDQLGPESAEVEARMKNCVSDDMHQRYECKERAIISNQLSLFGKVSGGGLLAFGPPLGMWLLARRAERPPRRRYTGSGAQASAQTVAMQNAGPRPPSIARWRIR
jgi:hypothetical protein